MCVLSIHTICAPITLQIYNKNYTFTHILYRIVISLFFFHVIKRMIVHGVSFLLLPLPHSFFIAFAEMKKRTGKTVKSAKKRKSRKIVIIAVVAVAVAVTAAAAVIAPYLTSGADATTRVYVYPNATSEAVADSLAATEGKNFAGRVGTLLWLLDVNLANRVGAYDIAPGDSPLDVARRIRNKGQAGVKFTFQNVRTKEQFAERAAAKFLMSKEDVMQCLNDSAFCASLGKTPATIPGVLMADSYEFYWGVSAKNMIQKIAGYADSFWTQERKAKAATLGLSTDDVVIIASIIEEETAKSDERGKVARLYINRLRQGMKLQADPTVKFALGDFALRRITHAMLTCESPYNTYRWEGLPPGPIRFPERSAIDAVLNAPEHNFTYMCAKEDFSGYHNFTDNYAAHLRNAARYQAELNKRGIR